MPQGPEKRVQNTGTKQFEYPEPVRVAGSGGAYTRFVIIPNKPLPPGEEIRLFVWKSCGKQYAHVWRTPTGTPSDLVGGSYLYPDQYRVEPVRTDTGFRQRPGPQPTTQRGHATRTPRQTPEARPAVVNEVSRSAAPLKPQPAPVLNAQPTPAADLTPSPESRATRESPSAPRSGDAVEGASPGVFGGWPTASELADLIDEKIDQVSRATRVIDRELDDLVTNHGGLPAVLAATAAQTMVDFGRERFENLKGRTTDLLRLGEGIARGDLEGLAEDFRRVATVFPMASEFRDAGMAASAAFRRAIILRRMLVNQYDRRVEYVYRKEIKRLMTKRPAMSNTKIGKEADKRTKEILKKEYEGIMEIRTDVKTQTTTGKYGDLKTMKEIDLVSDLLRHNNELKKSPAAVKHVQKLAQEIYAEIRGHTNSTIYGHPRLRRPANRRR